MTIARIPLTHPIASRTASTSKDSRSVNCLFETSGNERRIVKRPGFIKQNFGLPIAAGRGLFTWDNDVIVAQTTQLYRVTGQTPTLMGTITGTQPLSFAETAADAYLALHDGASLYTIDKATKTFVAPSGAVSSVSIDTMGGYYGYATSCTVAAGTPPTITAVAHGLVVGQGVTFTATTLPAGLTLGTTYQVASVPTVDTFTINTATTGGGAGAAVAVTTTGIAVKFLASPTVTFSAGAPTATGVATLYNHQVSGVIVTAAGTYTSLPTVTFSSPTVGTTATIPYLIAPSSNGVGTWTTTTQGSGYLSAPDLLIDVFNSITLSYETKVFKDVYGRYGVTTYTTLGTNGGVTSFTITADPFGGGFSRLSLSAPSSQTALGTVVMAAGGLTGPFAHGMEYLDGYVFVLTRAGRIYQSNLEDPTTWGALNYIEVNADPDSGVALARQLNYLVAFGEWSTEIFYNAGNPTASILGNNKSGKMEIGCAHGASVAKAEHTLLWMGQSKTEGRAVYLMEGLSPIKVSNRHIEKYLNASTLAEVYSYCFKIAGHTLYVLNLETDNLTFVYDIDEKEWYQWTSYDSLQSVSISVAPTSGIGTVSLSSIGSLAVNDPISFASFDTELPVTLTTGTTYYVKTININDITISTTPGGAALVFAVSPGVGFSGTGSLYGSTLPKTEKFFQMTAFNGNIEYAPALYFQHHHDGQIYTMSPDATADDVENIYFRVVTNIQDSGTTKRKFYIRAEVVGDKVAGTASIRHTSDDYQTWSTYRTVDLSITRPILYQLGQSRRRAWELLVTDNVPVRLEAIEIDFDVGEIGAS